MLLALFISNAGTALQVAAQAWYIWEQTHSAQQLGLLGLVQATPLLGVPLLGGIMADSWPRRTVLLVTQTLLAAIPALMGGLAFSGRLPTGLLLVLAGLLSTVMALDNSVRQVYLPGVVPQSRRGPTIGLNALSYNVGAVIGPALAGMLLPIGGAGWCFFANSLSYLLVIAWLVRGPEGRPATGRAGTAGLVDTGDTRGTVGIAGTGDQSEANKGMLGVGSYLLRSATTLLMLGLVAALSLLGRSYMHVLPALVSTNWKGDATAYGTLAALPGIGAVLAAGLTAWFLGRHQNAQGRSLYTPAICAGALLLGLAIVGLGLSQVLLVAGGVLIVVGFASTGTMTLLNAGLQSSTPNTLRGRVLSLYTILAAGMPALGGWILGNLMYAMTPPVALVIAGLTLALIAGVLGQRLIRTPLMLGSRVQDDT